jgi:hypothetical protein
LNARGLPVDIDGRFRGIAGFYRQKDMAGDAYRNRPAIG